jgi:hypothetical protein
MNYWIFKCNPQHYQLEKRLADTEPRATWRVSRYHDEIQTGDIAFIWETGRRRIRATIRIVSQPKEMPELKHELTHCLPSLDASVKCRIEAVFESRDFEPLAGFLHVFGGIECRQDQPDDGPK